VGVGGRAAARKYVCAAVNRFHRRDGDRDSDKEFGSAIPTFTRARGCVVIFTTSNMPRVALSACSALLLVLGAPAAAAARNYKRGFVADGCKSASCTDFSLLSSAGWFYAYNPADPFSTPSSPSTIHPEFVPMHWCTRGLANASIPAGTNATFLLGFNEPNNLHNCNMSPLEIATAWATVLELWAATSLLVSPATAGDGLPWLDQFFGNCTKLYGPRGCQVAHVAVHDYSCDAQQTMAYLTSVHARYKLPVWLTEFSCGDGAQHKPTADHIKYMREVFPLLDAAPFVYRYAWMSAGSANRGLVNGSAGAQTLTAVGEAFNAA
jgi:hypothetical protein